MVRLEIREGCIVLHHRIWSLNSCCHLQDLSSPHSKAEMLSPGMQLPSLRLRFLFIFLNVTERDTNLKTLNRNLTTTDPESQLGGGIIDSSLDPYPTLPACSGLNSSPHLLADLWQQRLDELHHRTWTQTPKSSSQLPENQSHRQVKSSQLPWTSQFDQVMTSCSPRAAACKPGTRCTRRTLSRCFSNAANDSSFAKLP